jgi:hypothetical protein
MAQQTYGEWMLSNPEAPKDDYKMKSTENVTNNHTLTAVEWFFENIDNEILKSEYYYMYQRAKQMEKEQIMRAYDKVSMSTPEQYYNQTYEK